MGRATTPTAVVVGGTGMLAGVVRGLAQRGWSVVVPSRHPWPTGTTAGDVRGVRTRWQEPEALARSVVGSIEGAARVLVAWVHTPHRGPVLNALAPVLEKDAPVVEVWGSAIADPLATLPPPVLTGHPTHQVVLGYERSGVGARWLTNSEIADGVLSVTDRALDGQSAGVHEVGTLRPWPPTGNRG